MPYYAKIKDGEVLSAYEFIDPTHAWEQAREVGEAIYQITEKEFNSWTLTRKATWNGVLTVCDSHESYSLDELKKIKVSELEAATRDFIERTQTGNRYSKEKQTSFNSIFQINQCVIADAVATQRERDAAQAKTGKLLQVFAWIKSVIAYHYQVKDAILNAEDNKDLASIDWDFDDFNDTDPNIHLQEVM